MSRHHMLTYKFKTLTQKMSSIYVETIIDKNTYNKDVTSCMFN